MLCIKLLAVRTKKKKKIYRVGLQDTEKVADIAETREDNY